MQSYYTGCWPAPDTAAKGRATHASGSAAWLPGSACECGGAPRCEEAARNEAAP